LEAIIAKSSFGNEDYFLGKLRLVEKVKKRRKYITIGKN